MLLTSLRSLLAKWLNGPPRLPHKPIRREHLISSLCTAERLKTREFIEWLRIIHPASLGQDGQTPQLHRKLWEWCFIIQALHERGFLTDGKRGLGFAVGAEALPALFAARGCEIVASDMDAEDAKRAGWVDTNQHSSHLDDLFKLGICEQEQFFRNVSYRCVDMNHIPTDLRGFDFCWSSCSFEHLGSIGMGEHFIDQMMHCLKPGGLAVHTTEFNLSSNRKTVDHQSTVIFRKRDIDRIARRLRKQGHQIEIDYFSGDDEADRYVDVPPYQYLPSLKLQLMGYVSTSIGLIVRKAG